MSRQLIPCECLEVRRYLSATAGTDLLPLNASMFEHNAWMMGSVNVTVVAFESDGSIDPDLSDWTVDGRENLIQSVQTGLHWWVDALDKFKSVHELSFNLDLTYVNSPVQTGFEPRLRSHLSWSVMQASFLERAGIDYQQFGSGNPREGLVQLGISAFNDRQRRENGTHWGLTIFVTNEAFRNEGGYEGAHDSGARAESESGAVYLLGYGHGENYSAVVSHEICHIFQAPDEYVDYPAAYEERNGVYNTPNHNAVGGNPHPERIVPSIMLELSADVVREHLISPSAAAAIGWQDSDADGIFDVLDQPHILNGSGSVVSSRQSYQFSGHSSVTLFDSQNPERFYSNDLTINTIDLIEYRLNGGPWITAETYHAYDTDVAFETPPLSAGDYTIEIRTRDVDSPASWATGIASNIFPDSFSVRPQILPPTMLSPATTTADLTPTFTWTSVNGAESYELWIQNLSTGAPPLKPIVSTVMYAPPSSLGIGRCAVWIRSIASDSVFSAWSPRYVVSINTPVAFSPLSHQQNIARPTISWTPLPGAERYDLWLNNQSTGQSQVVRNQNLTGTSWTPTSDLALGSYRVWVRGIDARGTAARWSSLMNFDVVPAPTLTSPQFATFNHQPMFTWTPVTGATKYEVFLQNLNNGITTYDVKNLTATSWTPPAELADGPYRWWVQARSAHDATSLWSAPTDVYIGGLATVTGPVGSTGQSSPTFTWRPVQGAIRYELWVSSATTQARVIYQTALTGTSFTPTSSLAKDNYRVWVRAVSSTGEKAVWSKDVSFTVVDGTRLKSEMARSLLASLRGEQSELSETSSIDESATTLPRKDEEGPPVAGSVQRLDNSCGYAPAAERSIVASEPCELINAPEHGLLFDPAWRGFSDSGESLNGDPGLPDNFSQIDQLMASYEIDA